MKIKYIPIIIALLLFICISKPIFHLLKTYWKENIATLDSPKGFTNDASRLNLTKIDTIIQVSSDDKQSIQELQSLLNYAYLYQKPISIAGKKYAMGGHSVYPNGIVLEMSNFKTIHIDTINNRMIVGAGATWNDAIAQLNKFNRSVKVMQAFSSFSIGGSISVNGHGWQRNSPPISSSILSLTVMTADGQVVKCSLSENEDLFRLVIGGYGLFGIILTAEIEIVENSSLKYTRKTFPTDHFLEYFNTYVTTNPRVELVYGRLDITHANFLNTASLNIFTKTSDVPNSNYHNIPIELKRLIFRGTVHNEYGKQLRNDLERYATILAKDHVFSRNELLNESVLLIENRDSLSVDILQEYFIPDRNFNRFISDIKKILPHSELDLLNITIRDVEKDTISYMNYAREHVFGFVFLFNQPNNKTGELAMKNLTQHLTRIALENQGTYYLPYRLHNSKMLFQHAYPQSISFFQKKKKYDPHSLFKNIFYEVYK